MKKLPVIILIAVIAVVAIVLGMKIYNNEKQLQEEAHERLIAEFNEATGDPADFAK